MSTMSSISPTNVKAFVGISPEGTTVVETIVSSMNLATVDLDHDSASDEDFIFSDSSFFGRIGFVHRVQDQPPSSWPMTSRPRAIFKCTSPRFSIVHSGKEHG